MTQFVDWLRGAMRSKTIWAAIILAAVAWLENAGMLGIPVSPEVQKALLALLMIALRSVTNQALSEKVRPTGA